MERERQISEDNGSVWRRAGLRIGAVVLAGSALAGFNSIREDETLPDIQEVAAPSSPRTIYRTGGDGLWLHTSAGLKTPLVTLMPEGARFDVSCFRTSDSVNGNPVWLDGIYIGQYGSASDYYVNTKWNTQQDLENQGIPKCESGAPQNNLPKEQSKKEQSLYPDIYDRDAAVNWARKHAQDAPPHASACTWFVSNALWAGGLDKSKEWTSTGNFGYQPDPFDKSYRPGTPSAWAVPLFLKYFQSKYPFSSFKELSFQTNSLPQAQAGDIVIYDWEGDGKLDHAAIVTEIATNQYPEVSEWSAYDGRTPTPYIDRGWTYSKKNGDWLQKNSPGIKAYLLHIDTTAVSSY